MNREIHDIVKSLIKEFGWTFKAKNTHVKIWHAESNITLVVPHSPSDGRAVKNFLSDVRRAGFAL